MGTLSRLTAACTALAAAVTLAACSGGSDEPPERALPGPVASPATSDPEPTETKPVGGFGTYTFESPEGIKGTLTIPTKPTDPAVREYEAYRKLAKGKPTTYILATVDNQSADASANMYQVVVVTDDGEQLVFEGASNRVDEWMNAFSSDTQDGVDKYNRGVDLSNKTLEALRPGAKGKRVMAVEGKLPSVQRVFVYPNGGFSEVQAVKAS